MDDFSKAIKPVDCLITNFHSNCVDDFGKAIKPQTNNDYNAKRRNDVFKGFNIAALVPLVWKRKLFTGSILLATYVTYSHPQMYQLQLPLPFI